MPLSVSMPAPNAAHQFTNSPIHNSTVSPVSVRHRMVNPCCEQHGSLIQYIQPIQTSLISWITTHFFKSCLGLHEATPALSKTLLPNTSSSGLRASRARWGICICYMNTLLNLHIASKIESDKLI